MTEENENIVNFSNDNEELKRLVPISEMYQDWFLDYASYVILERSVPFILDGLKPVQRRILHSLKEMHDGRYNKVANIIGNTMKYHPHGDASIGDALVKIGQKELLIDMQGNWGNIFTGDRAAAPRYIEARLSQFALDVVFSPKVTEWDDSYDGRSKEPVSLPIKFPLLLNQGAEGIAVGLSTKILSHNFIELIDASIAILRGKSKKILPDFITGGIADFSDYNDGKRGGKVILRARIESIDNYTLKITEIPFGTTTTSLIESILKSNEKGKIKIKKIEDNTAEHVEILIYLPVGVSIDKTIDALYAFTDCQISISPISCIIFNEKPVFLGVSEILKICTENTKTLLKKELQIKLKELEEKWQMFTLEQIFIEERIYRKIEEIELWEKVLDVIYESLCPYEKDLIRPIKREDVIQLTEIKIKKITRYDLEKEKQKIFKIEEEIKETKNHIKHLIEYAINYFKKIKTDHSVGRKRKTEIKIFDKIVASKVAIANKRLYVNRLDGFIGTSLRKDEFICDCSDIDDIIVFNRNGTMLVTKVKNKTFVGKDIIHVAVFKKNDDRTIYNMIYRDQITNKSYVKRFPVKGVTRDREYLLVNSTKCIILYFSANPNGEAEIVSVMLRAKAKLKKMRLELNFSDVLIKNRMVKGNLVTNHSINRVELKSEGVSTLSGKKIWFDKSIFRLNDENRGTYLGEFSSDDKILMICRSGYVELLSYDLSNHFPEDMIFLEQYSPQKPITSIYFHSDKKMFYIKRFMPPVKLKKTNILHGGKDSYLELVFSEDDFKINLTFTKLRNKEQRPDLILNPSELISVKGMTALGNQLSRYSIKSISTIKEEKNHIIDDQIVDLNTDNNQMTINF